MRELRDRCRTFSVFKCVLPLVFVPRRIADCHHHLLSGPHPLTSKTCFSLHSAQIFYELRSTRWPSSIRVAAMMAGGAINIFELSVKIAPEKPGIAVASLVNRPATGADFHEMASRWTARCTGPSRKCARCTVFWLIIDNQPTRINTYTKHWMC